MALTDPRNMFYIINHGRRLPHTDDMRQMLADLGIEDPPTYEEWVREMIKGMGYLSKRWERPKYGERGVRR
jgi:HEPN domain-containing protein